MKCCVKDDKTAILFPEGVAITGENSLVLALNSQAASGEAGGGVEDHIVPKILKSLAAVAGATLPADRQGEDTSLAWVLENYPAMATVFSLCQLTRALQRSGARLCKTFLGDENKAADYLVQGLGDEFTAFSNKVDEAARYGSSANEAILSLHGPSSSPPSAADATTVEQLLFPNVTHFNQIVGDCRTLRQAIKQSAVQKAKIFLEAPRDACSATFHKDFRGFSGVQDRTQRDITTIAMEMGQKPIVKVGPSCKVLLEAITTVEASASFLPVGKLLAQARHVEASGRFWIAVANSLVNLVVKPAKKYPGDLLKDDLKHNILGLCKMGFWTAPKPVAVADGGASHNAAEVPLIQNWFCEDLSSTDNLASVF